MTDEQIAQAWAMRKHKMSYRKIGTALGVASKTVRRTLDLQVRKQNRLYSAENCKDHLPEYNANCGVREALVRGATISNLAEIVQIYKRARKDPKVRCYLCGDLIPFGHRHVDHIVPLSKGGPHRPSNLAVTCDHCNVSKGVKMPEEIGLLL